MRAREAGRRIKTQPNGTSYKHFTLTYFGKFCFCPTIFALIKSAFSHGDMIILSQQLRNSGKKKDL